MLTTMYGKVRSRLGRWAFRTATAVLMCAGLAGGWALGLQIVGNVHVVERGLVYRAAQLNGERLESLLKTYGIKSVINLRGENRGSAWYDNEIAVTASLGVSHYDVRMSALNEPNDELVVQLIEELRLAPRPILIHCASGSDRTGLASALYEKFVERRSTEMASRQISFRYGHFPWLGNRSVAMDHTFARLVDRGLPHVRD
jgi:protein tyrosine/serine phosphatase